SPGYHVPGVDLLTVLHQHVGAADGDGHRRAEPQPFRYGSVGVHPVARIDQQRTGAWQLAPPDGARDAPELWTLELRSQLSSASQRSLASGASGPRRASTIKP